MWRWLIRFGVLLITAVGWWGYLVFYPIAWTDAVLFGSNSVVEKQVDVQPWERSSNQVARDAYVRRGVKVLPFHIITFTQAASNPQSDQSSQLLSSTGTIRTTRAAIAVIMSLGCECLVMCVWGMLKRGDVRLRLPVHKLSPENREEK